MTTKQVKKLPEEGYIRLKEVLEFIPVSKATWWNGIKKGIYPKGVKISARVTAWNVVDIKKLILKLSKV